MLESYYHHKIIEKIVAGFGTLFNNIYVARTNSASEEVERFKIPIAYGPKQKWVARLDQADPDLINRVEIALPRMGYELVTFNYDSDRKLPSTQPYVDISPTTGSLKKRLERVPYTVNFNLHIVSKNTTDALQIIEQILPYFTPDYVITYRLMGIDSAIDVPITLDNVSFEENYEGSMEDRKSFIATLNFSARIHLFGPVKTSKTIQRIDVNFFDKYDTRTGKLYGVQGTVSGNTLTYLGATGITLETMIVSVTGGATAGTDFGITGTSTDIIIY